MGIADILLERGLIAPEHLTEATALRQREGLRLDQALVKLGAVEEEQLLRIAAEQLAIEMVDLADEPIDVQTLRSLPPKLVYRKHIVPLGKSDGALTVATCDPFELYAFDEVRLITGLEVRPVLAPREQIDRIIKTHYGVGGETVDEMIADDELEVLDEAGETVEDLTEMAQEASVIKLVNEIFLEAVNERASDIHIEPYRHELKIRYRVDGVLQETSVPPQIQQFQAAIISRIKIMAKLNIAERRLPQDGRISIQVGGSDIDVRVSVIPMLYGEGIVLRILNKSEVRFTLRELGMAEDDFRQFGRLISRPHGIVLVTGPTGSGKTTTLYAALQEVVSPQVKVLTIEDPVEYNLDGVNQIQVQQKIGLTFARGLRHILRHDPDVVMIGEIRDLETAQAAVQAALTGHLVFSTLHTNDSCSASTRLLDMGVEPYLVASTLEAVMAQRLVRTICPDCKQPYRPDPRKLPKDFAPTGEEELYRGAGCRRCRGSGYRGRTGIFELLVLSDGFREKIMSRATTTALAATARADGLRLLREDGWMKVREGSTTPEEVLRCTKL